MNYALTHHAAIRAQQRGLPRHLISTFMENADFEAPIGSGCTVIRMTDKRFQDTELAVTLGSDRERLRGISIIWSERTSEIVTVIRPRRGPAGRRYRRGE